MNWLWILGGVLVAYALLLFLVARAFLKPKRLPFFLSPGLLGMPQDDVAIRTRDGVTLRGWWSQNPNEKFVAILCHGYFMNRSEMCGVAYQLWKWGASTLLFDFRAHGRSGGALTGLGWQERQDVFAAFTYAKSMSPNSNILIVGSSMGGSAATFALSEDGSLAQGLVLDSSYARLDHAITGWWRFLGGPLLAIFLRPTVLFSGLLLEKSPKKVNVTEALKKLQSKPVLMFHGTADDLVDPNHARKNQQALGHGAKLVWFEKCNHTEGRMLYPDRYYEELRLFLVQNGFLLDESSAGKVFAGVSAISGINMGLPSNQGTT